MKDHLIIIVDLIHQFANSGIGAEIGVITAVIEYANKSKAFVMPENPQPLSKLSNRAKYIPAPRNKPVIIKSWPVGHMWALKH